MIGWLIIGGVALWALQQKPATPQAGGAVVMRPILKGIPVTLPHGPVAQSFGGNEPILPGAPVSPIPAPVLQELASSGFEPIAPGSNIAAADQTGRDIVAAKLARYSSEGPTVQQQQVTLLADANSFNLAGTPDFYYGDSGSGSESGASGAASDIIATAGGAFR